MFQNQLFKNHEHVSFISDSSVGLKAVVAVHSTKLGPSLGGCRIRSYAAEQDAVNDVLRLSEAMTYKSSLAGLRLGGGKACIIADPKMINGRKELLHRFAHFLNNLSGTYITAEDMGTTVQDIEVMREVTPYAAGYSKEKGGSGNPAPWTALGVFEGLKKAANIVFHTESLSGLTVGVEGVGNVGSHLIEHLLTAGAKIIITDKDEVKVKNILEKFNEMIKFVQLKDFYDQKFDIYSPCAVGQTVNSDSLSRIKAKLIAGAANNQLADSSTSEILKKKNIIYCPDFAINAGGIISIAGEYEPGGWQENWVKEKVLNIANTIENILNQSKKDKNSTEDIAINMSKNRLLA